MELFNRYFVNVLKNRYAQFTGRARRSEFWYFALFSSIVTIVLTILGSMLFKTTLLANLYNLAVFVPSLALAARRLHDIDKSGWFLLLLFVPLIGWAILLYFYVLDSQPGSNKYGPCPK